MRLETLSFAYGARAVVESVSLEVPAGAFFALLGASGSGKTTLLKLIGGYLTPSCGGIMLAGRDITSLPPERRRVGMVFQSYALFPHLSARGNVTFGLEARGVARDECRRRVEEALDRVALANEARDRKPSGLSGGQQQRVALARALVIEPDLLLLDEPLANLDRRLREQVRGELRTLQRRTGVTTVLVTHDPEEAMALADGIGVMAAGRLLQTGPPREVYERPVCPYVARLLGDANLLEVTAVGDGDKMLAGGLTLAALPGASVGDVVLVRPERIVLECGDASPLPFLLSRGEGDDGMDDDGKGDDDVRDSNPTRRVEKKAKAVMHHRTPKGLPARVLNMSYRGGDTLVELRVGETTLLASVRADDLPHSADVVIHIPHDALYLLPRCDPPELRT